MFLARQDVSAETLRVSSATSDCRDCESPDRCSAPRRRHHSRNKRVRPRTWQHEAVTCEQRRGPAVAEPVPLSKCPSLGAGKAVFVRLLGHLGHTLRAILMLLFRLLIATVLRPFAWIYFRLYEFPAEMQFRRTTQRFMGVLNSTESFRTFLPAAKQLDAHLGIDTWRLEAPPRTICNAEGLVFDAQVALHLARSGNTLAMGYFLRAMLLRNAHGMVDPRLYPYFTGTKACIEDYSSAICLLVAVFSGSRPPSDALKLTVRPCFQVREPPSTGEKTSSSPPFADVEKPPGRQGTAPPPGTVDVTELAAVAINQQATRRRTLPSSRYGRRTQCSDAPLALSMSGELTITHSLSAHGGDSNRYNTLVELEAPQLNESGYDELENGNGGDASEPSVSAPTSPDPQATSTDTAEVTAEGRSSSSCGEVSGTTTSGRTLSDPPSAFTVSIVAWTSAYATTGNVQASSGTNTCMVTSPLRADGSDLTITTEPRTPLLTIRQRLDVLREVLQSFGRTALILSGGASMGTYHTGVVRALFEAGVLPDIMAGSSAGSIIAALLCTKLPSELKRFIEVDVLSTEALQLTPFGRDTGLAQKVRRFLKTGFLMDVRTLMECMRTHCGDLTFLEAYRISGRVLNICVTRDQQKGTHFDRHVLLNFRTSPNVVVWSAVSASCALPGLFTAVQLIEKSPETGFFQPYLPGELYCDGSVAQDIPRDRLAQLFNVNYCIVSQVNPYVIPFLHPERPSAADATTGTAVLPHRLTVGSRMSFTGRLWYRWASLSRHLLLRCFDSGVLPKKGALEVPFMLLTQSYSDDVTLLPIGDTTSAVPDYLNMVNNPTAEYISYVASRGQVRTWPFVARIRSASRIERALSREIAVLEKALEHSERGIK